MDKQLECMNQCQVHQFGINGITQYLYIYVNLGNRDFKIFSDGIIMYMITDPNPGYFQGGCVFGDIISYKIDDNWNCYFGGSASSSAYQNNNSLAPGSGTTGHYMARSYSQFDFAAQCYLYSHSKVGNDISGGGVASANPVDNVVHCYPLEIYEGVNPRGVFPGVFCPINVPTTDTAIIGDNGSMMYAATYGNAGSRLIFDITGDWR